MARLLYILEQCSTKYPNFRYWNSLHYKIQYNPLNFVKANIKLLMYTQDQIYLYAQHSFKVSYIKIFFISKPVFQNFLYIGTDYYLILNFY